MGALGLGRRWQRRRSRRPRRRQGGSACLHRLCFARFRRGGETANLQASLNEKLRRRARQTARAMGTSISMVLHHWYVGTASCDQGCQRESAALSVTSRPVRVSGERSRVAAGQWSSVWGAFPDDNRSRWGLGSGFHSEFGEAHGRMQSHGAAQITRQ